MSESEDTEVPVEATDLTFPMEEVELRIRGPRIGIWTLINGISWTGGMITRFPHPDPAQAGPVAVVCQDVVDQYRELDDVDEAREEVGRGIRSTPEQVKDCLEVEFLEDVEADDG